MGVVAGAVRDLLSLQTVIPAATNIPCTTIFRIHLQRKTYLF
ncbi:MAG: hypothetical protein ACJAZP_001970 [Psychromonas sp.]|jgi:hypothetical protein